jgi:hypothetical protein
MHLIKSCTKLSIILMMVSLVVTGMALVPGQAGHAQADAGATIATDKSDYEPGETVNVLGTGFQPGETVHLSAQGDTNETLLESDVVADENGTFKYSLELPLMYEATYTLTATGTVSEQVQVTFDDKVTSLQIQTPSDPVTVCRGGTQLYTAAAKTTGGDPIEGVTITWSVQDGSGSMSPGTSDTDEYGLASSLLTVYTTASLTQDWVIGIASDKEAKQKFDIAASCCTAPSITAQPDDATKTVGESVTFSVTATGTAPLSYQWRKGGVDISGATGISYTISPVALSDAGSYDVVVSNSCGSATSSAATLTVTAAEVSITITSSPVTGSGFVKVDNVAYDTPQVFSWVPGSTHSLEALSPVAGAAGTQYVWTDWSDTGNQIHDYIVPSAGETVTANYKTQYRVSFEQTGSAVAPEVTYTADTDPVGTVPFDVWVKAGTDISYTYQDPVPGDPGVRYALSSVSPESPQTVNGPLTIEGVYHTEYELTLVTDPAGLTTPSGGGWYDADTSANISTTNPISSPPNTYFFAGWTTVDQDEIAEQYSLSTTVLMDKAKTVTANYQRMTKSTCGKSMGFWTNKNGQALIKLPWAAGLNALAPYAAFTPYPKEPSGSTPFNTGNLSKFKSQVKNYILNANATDMRYMLAAQLLATELSLGTRGGCLEPFEEVWLDDGDLVFEPGEAVTIGSIMDNAITQWQTGTRATQEAVKNLLDKINNNLLWFVI